MIWLAQQLVAFWIIVVSLAIFVGIGFRIAAAYRVEEPNEH